MFKDEDRPRTDNSSAPGETVVMCPYFRVPCVSFCPGWIETLNSCAFPACLTDVKEVFMEAGRYLDERLGMYEGTGYATLEKVRAFFIQEHLGIVSAIDSDALKQVRFNMAKTVTEEDRNVAKGVIGSFFTTGIVAKMAKIPVEQIGRFISKADDAVTFSIADLVTPTKMQDDGDVDGDVDGIVFELEPDAQAEGEPGS